MTAVLGADLRCAARQFPTALTCIDQHFRWSFTRGWRRSAAQYVQFRAMIRQRRGQQLLVVVELQLTITMIIVVVVNIILVEIRIINDRGSVTVAVAVAVAIVVVDIMGAVLNRLSA